MGPSADSVASGDAHYEGFDAWYREHYPRVRRALVVAAGSVELADDLTQEAFARALSRWDQVRSMAAPEAWTYTVAVNLLRRRLRRRAVEQRLLRRESATEPPSTLFVELWDVLQSLPLRQRTAIALRYFGDLRERDVAAAMHISSGTVARLLHDARRSLEAKLSEKPEKETNHVRSA